MSRALIALRTGMPADSAARIASCARQIGFDTDAVAFADTVRPEAAAAYLATRAPDHAVVLASASPWGAEVLSRASALCAAPMASDVIAIDKGRLVRRQFSESIESVLARPSSGPLFLTVRTAAFEPAANPPTVRSVSDVPVVRSTRVVGRAAPPASELTTARVVVGAGRGVATPARMDQVRAIAARLGAAVGVTRPVIEAGLATPDVLLGQSGRTVTPALYLALGISGAVQHLAGVKDSGLIVAINTDASAPMLAAADFVLVQELDEALPALAQALR